MILEPREIILQIRTLHHFFAPTGNFGNDPTRLKERKFAELTNSFRAESPQQSFALGCPQQRVVRRDEFICATKRKPVFATSFSALFNLAQVTHLGATKHLAVTYPLSQRLDPPG